MVMSNLVCINYTKINSPTGSFQLSAYRTISEQVYELNLALCGCAWEVERSNKHIIVFCGLIRTRHRNIARFLMRSKVVVIV